MPHVALTIDAAAGILIPLLGLVLFPLIIMGVWRAVVERLGVTMREHLRDTDKPRNLGLLPWSVRTGEVRYRGSLLLDSIREAWQVKAGALSLHKTRTLRFLLAEVPEDDGASEGGRDGAASLARRRATQTLVCFEAIVVINGLTFAMLAIMFLSGVLSGG